MKLALSLAAAALLACSGSGDALSDAGDDAGAPDTGTPVDASGNDAAPDVAPPNTLTVVNVGLNGGTGTVTSDVGGIDCGATCSAVVAPGTTVTLTAAPGFDSFFSGWSGGGCTGTGTCAVTVTGGATVTATFKTFGYANSTDTLYRINGDTDAFTTVGAFGGDCAGLVIGDIAIDHTGAMYAVSIGGTPGLFAVDDTTATCTHVGNLGGPTCNGLTFGADPNDTSSDLLYAGCATSLYTIDVATGAATQVGAFGNGLSSSGDILSVRGFGTFATLTSGSGNDVLAAVDPATGQATVVGTDIGYAQVWGLGYANGALLGFTGADQLLSIDDTTGAGAVLDPATNVAAYGAAAWSAQ
jgi:hypothetical protein